LRVLRPWPGRRRRCRSSNGDATAQTASVKTRKNQAYGLHA
jgi:hypothetical protein